MSRPGPTWARYALVALVAASLGAAIGLELAPKHIDRIIHCSVEHAPGWPPCPPDNGRVVWAAWDGGVRTLASWNGREWVFAQPVLGRHYTSEAPIAWGEL